MAEACPATNSQCSSRKVFVFLSAASEVFVSQYLTALPPAMSRMSANVKIMGPAFV
jgi:hypothetical protein